MTSRVIHLSMRDRARTPRSPSGAVLRRRGLRPNRPAYERVKRAFDLSLCLLMAPAALLLVAACALAALVCDGRPIFFMQDRRGRGGRRFRMCLAVLPLAATLFSTPWLWDAGLLYRAAALAQAALYSAAALGALVAARGGRLAKLLALPTFFRLANAAAGLAAWNVLRGRRIDSWEPQRAAAVAPGALGGSRS